MKCVLLLILHSYVLVWTFVWPLHKLAIISSPVWLLCGSQGRERALLLNQDVLAHPLDDGCHYLQCPFLSLWLLCGSLVFELDRVYTPVTWCIYSCVCTTMSLFTLKSVHSGALSETAWYYGYIIYSTMCTDVMHAFCAAKSDRIDYSPKAVPRKWSPKDL